MKKPCVFLYIYFSFFKKSQLASEHKKVRFLGFWNQALIYYLFSEHVRSWEDIIWSWKGSFHKWGCSLSMTYHIK